MQLTRALDLLKENSKITDEYLLDRILKFEAEDLQSRDYADMYRRILVWITNSDYTTEFTNAGLHKLSMQELTKLIELVIDYRKGRILASIAQIREKQNGKEIIFRDFSWWSKC